MKDKNKFVQYAGGRSKSMGSYISIREINSLKSQLQIGEKLQYRVKIVVETEAGKQEKYAKRTGRFYTWGVVESSKRFEIHAHPGSKYFARETNNKQGTERIFNTVKGGLN